MTLTLEKCFLHLLAFAFVLSAANTAPANEPVTNGITLFVESACVDCHNADTDTGFDMTALKFDLANDKAFRRWERIFDRIDRGEMPPPDEAQPDEDARKSALASLKSELLKANMLTQQTRGRVPSRRLSREEYENTLHDLLHIGGNLAKHLPPENEAGTFDVVAASQDMSSVHIRGLLTAADLALDEAIQLGRKPPMAEKKIDYLNSKYIQMWVDRPIRRGGGTIFKTEEDIVTFRGENFVFRSDASGFIPPVAGRYFIRVKAAPYQQRSSITVSLKRQNDTQGESELFAAWDLVDDQYREFSTVKYLRPDDYIYISADELEPAPDGTVIYNTEDAESFRGEGVKIREVTVEGPLEANWPPERTRRLLPGIEWKAVLKDYAFYDWGNLEKLKTYYSKRVYDPVLAKEPREHIRELVQRFAAKAFGRKLSAAEVEAFVSLADETLKADQDFVSTVRIPLRSILVAPELLFLGNVNRKPETKGWIKLSDHQLARRLSYFLWRTCPDKELARLAEQHKLSEPNVLRGQVNRMLDDPRSHRFIDSFLGQWLELDRIDATTPDTYLYPEYDDVLRAAMLSETRKFFSHLISENRSVRNLIDSDFTFLNRKLAEHYGIDGVEGETMRKVILPKDSLRGGILTHASIAKVTANGTVTTPVKRGSFVLTNLLGLPPNPPPPGVGAIEPDTRGATTIRETLEKHKDNVTCAACHREIDPPGFALECFDPIGNFRNRYRNSIGIKYEIPAGLRTKRKAYYPGRAVDCSSTTADGFEFEDIREFKQHLLKSTQQVARNVANKLVTFSTGGEIQFADRDEVEKILQATEAEGYPLRSLIHHVVASRMFRNL